jgi:hypothetical protein
VGDGPISLNEQCAKIWRYIETYVALAANHLVAVILGSKSLERWLNKSTTETENEMKGGFLELMISHLSPQIAFVESQSCHIEHRFLLPLAAMQTHLLDVVIAQGTSIFQLLSGENQSLLVRWDSLLVLNFGLDIVNGVARLHLKGDSLAREGLDETVACQ